MLMERGIAGTRRSCKKFELVHWTCTLPSWIRQGELKRAVFIEVLTISLTYTSSLGIKCGNVSISVLFRSSLDLIEFKCTTHFLRRTGQITLGTLVRFTIQPDQINQIEPGGIHSTCRSSVSFCLRPVSHSLVPCLYEDPTARQVT
jgi:hypothetical protein